MRPVHCIFLGFFTSFFLLAWYAYPLIKRGEGPASFVEIQFLASVEETPLYKVTMISGPYKKTIGNIAPGEVQDAKVYPNQSNGNEITLFIHRDASNPDRYTSWEGKRYHPAGTTFRTRIQINPHGEVVSEKSCKLPCSFD